MLAIFGIISFRLFINLFCCLKIGCLKIICKMIDTKYDTTYNIVGGIQNVKVG